MKILVCFIKFFDVIVICFSEKNMRADLLLQGLGYYSHPVFLVGDTFNTFCLQLTNFFQFHKILSI